MLKIFTQGYVYWFLQREEGEEREKEKHWYKRNINWLPHIHNLTGDWWNPQPRYVSWPGIELWPFGVWYNAPTNWPIRPRQNVFLNMFSTFTILIKYSYPKLSRLKCKIQWQFIVFSSIDLSHTWPLINCEWKPCHLSGMILSHSWSNQRIGKLLL